jgi:ribosomal protein S27E
MQKTDNGAPRRTLYRHPIAAIGGAMIIAGGFLFAMLLLLDLTAGDENPYRAMATFIFAPSIVIIGLLIFGWSALLQVRAARARGEKVKFNLRIDFSDPLYVRNLWLFLGLSALLLVIAGYTGTRAFESTESVAFCGETCHSVMKPQYVTYQHSAHARVKCVDCHIGPGATFWVKSKIDGARQIFATMLETYPRPIPTPVHDLRPARETCEGCHWPDQFYGSKLVSKTYYQTDEKNSPWTINLLMKIGGANPRIPAEGGIHWHMLSETRVEYSAADYKRQQILQVRSIDPSGETRTYNNSALADVEPPAGNAGMREFDCMDCHNRPSHIFLPPAVAMNQALRARKISPDLPYVRKVGLDLLNADYSDEQQALAAIESGLRRYYHDEHGELAEIAAVKIDDAARALQGIYSDNFFPEMKTDYRARESNLSHFVNDGCFRCHNTDMVDDKGQSLAYECDTCHLIIAQGPSETVSELESDLAGLAFRHPVDIMEMWKDAPCTSCHTPESGY